MNYKVIFFPDELQAHTTKLKQELSKSYTCFLSNNTDEYRQVFFQTGKIVLIFTDAKKAVHFKHDLDPNMKDLEFMVMVYLPTDASFNAKSQKIIDDHRIKIYKKSELAKLHDDLKDFYDSTDKDLDLQFILPDDD